LRAELELVETHARAVAGLRSERVEVGAFDAFFATSDPVGPEGPAYAIPARPAADKGQLAADLATLAQAFHARGVPVSVELTLFLWPEIPPALAAAGLVQVEDSPLFVLDPASFRPRRPDALSTRWIAPGEIPAFALSLVRQGFELRGPPPAPEEVAALRASLDGPLRLAIADLDGRPAGAGFSIPAGPPPRTSALPHPPA